MSNDRDDFLTMSAEELCRRCRMTFTKDTGAGGQKRNKTSSAVQLELPELGVSASDCTERSQHRNRANALRKLRLAVAYGSRKTPAVPPENIDCSTSSEAYPLWVARLLDLAAEEACDHRAVAARCGISPSAMLKKLYRDPRLWQHVQGMRQERGLAPLRPPR